MTETAALEKLAALEIETPSWGYGNSGTRFHVFPWPGAARTVWERIDDAALVHRLTGCCPSVALHIPWDRVEDWAALREYASERGIRIGAINPNLFGDDAYRLGSLCHPDDRVRSQALEHCRECVEIAQQVDDHQPLARRRNELSRPGRPARKACATRDRTGRALPASPCRHALAHRVQVLRAGLLQH
jgi:L-rhamnose isomerase